MKKLEIKSWWDGDTTIYSLETESGDVIGRYWSFEDANEAKAKEEMNMKRAQGAVEVKDFELNGVRYTNTRPNYYYKKENGKQVRIGKAEWDAAWNASGEAERQAREAKQAEADKEAEKKFNKEKKTASKPRRSKDIAYEGFGVTLTAKQVDFIKLLPKTSMWDGAANGVWCDCIAEDIEWNPMSVGAMISTLREKNVIVVGKQKVNGKQAKFFEFTDLGLDLAEKLGVK